MIRAIRALRARLATLIAPAGLLAVVPMTAEEQAEFFAGFADPCPCGPDCLCIPYTNPDGSPNNG